MTAAEPTTYPELNSLLRELVSGAREVLGDLFTAAYLLGSFAVGDADEHSDVDFLVAVEDEPTGDRLEAVRALHRRLHDRDTRWARRLDGSYVPRRILRRHDPARTRLLYLDNGSRELVRSEHCNRHAIRWMVRERGIRLAGPDPKSLVAPVPEDELRREMLADMRGWAEEIRAEPSVMANRYYQPYAVLSYCRMLYTLDEGAIVSKPVAARWALEALDPCWSGLIQRALDARPHPEQRQRQKADPRDFQQTLAFIDAALVRARARRD